MRGNAAAHELVAPGSLSAVLDLLAAAPGQWTPIAGGTELMVAFAAGRLTAGKLVSLWGISRTPLHRQPTPDRSVIGGGTTFSDLRANPIVASEFPLLDKSASWIGSIANQTRATLGGNLVNGSPAADSSPALLVYDAEIELISVRGKRRMPYCEFHTGYKQNAMTADELLVRRPPAAAFRPSSAVSAQSRYAARDGHLESRSRCDGVDEGWRNRRNSRGCRKPRALSRSPIQD